MYKDATLFFLQDNIVTIANVVPTMDCIDDMLSSSVKTPLNPAVKHMLTIACKLMDKYYSKTIHNSSSSISSSMGGQRIGLKLEIQGPVAATAK
jgi:hypothetical protein